LPSDTWLAYALRSPSTATQEADGETDPPADADVDPPPPATATDGEDPETPVETPVDVPEPAQDATADVERIGAVRSVAQLTFGDPINAPTLRYRIRLAYTRIHGDPEGVAEAADSQDDADLLEVPGLLVDTGDLFVWDQDSSVTSQEWYVTMFGSEKELAEVLARVQADMAQTPVFPSSSSIGGKVAGDTRNLAVAALVASLFGILAYIWIRFQRVVFGVAAVIALIHDMLIVVGAIALSAYVSRYFGFLLIEEFKISLPMVAALLTIMGYSLNDTIVVFDRIREVRGKSPDLTADMINLSVNQTLSRTLLTSLTTLIVAVILYSVGGQGIHGFAFALLVGVLVGTYSSVFIAAPALLWLFNRARVAG
jgi:SecD/SecF fusion protein